MEKSDRKKPWVSRRRYVLVQPHDNSESTGGWCAQVFASSPEAGEAFGSWGVQHHVFRYKWMAIIWARLFSQKYTVDWI